MKRKDYYNLINKELSRFNINGESLLSFISDYDREKICKGFYDRFINPIEAIEVLRTQFSNTHE